MIDISEHGGSFGGGNGSGIKKIRHVSASWDDNYQLEKIIPIEPVNPDNTVVIAHSPAEDVSIGSHHFAGVLMGSDQMKIIRGYAGGSSTPPLHFTLIEFERAKRKQEGIVYSNSSGSYIFMIDPVNIDRSLVFVSANHAFGGSTYDGHVHAYFVDSTSVRIDGTFSSQKYYWQVIEFY